VLFHSSGAKSGLLINGSENACAAMLTRWANLKRSASLCENELSQRAFFLSESAVDDLKCWARLKAPCLQQTLPNLLATTSLNSAKEYYQKHGDQISQQLVPRCELPFGVEYFNKTSMFSKHIPTANVIFIL